MTVRIITDSTTDVTPAAARQLNLGVVPLKVLFGQEEYRDGIDLTMEEFYTKLTSNDQLPTTSQPSPNRCADVVQSAQRHVSICPAG